ncbi:MAG: hypothetical protein ABR577_09010 [Pyrinomonadaceae bacterium]
MKTKAQTLVIALAMLATLTIGSSMASGQNKEDKQAIASSQDEQGNDLVGVWEEVAPATIDCVTRQPNGPVINVLYTFNQGGTMYVEDTLPVDRNRTTGGGIWKRTSGRNYVYVNSHYAFDPNGTFLFTIKQRSNVRLSRDGNSFTENGTFEAVAPNGDVLFSGCFAATAHRMTF